MLKRDWNQFLMTNYPEIFNNDIVPEDNEMKHPIDKGGSEGIKVIEENSVVL
jgi:hypothetical protein